MQCTLSLSDMTNWAKALQNERVKVLQFKNNQLTFKCAGLRPIIFQQAWYLAQGKLKHTNYFHGVHDWAHSVPFSKKNNVRFPKVRLSGWAPLLKRFSFASYLQKCYCTSLALKKYETLRKIICVFLWILHIKYYSQDIYISMLYLYLSISEIKITGK